MKKSGRRAAGDSGEGPPEPRGDRANVDRFEIVVPPPKVWHTPDQILSRGASAAPEAADLFFQVWPNTYAWKGSRGRPFPPGLDLTSPDGHLSLSALGPAPEGVPKGGRAAGFRAVVGHLVVA